MFSLLTFQQNMYHLQKLGRLLCAHLLTWTIILIFACKGTSALRTPSYGLHRECANSHNRFDQTIFRACVHNNNNNVNRFFSRVHTG